MGGDNGQSSRREHLRATLLAKVDDATARELPALSRELRMVEGELERLGLPTEQPSVADELAARYKARHSQPRRDGRLN